MSFKSFFLYLKLIGLIQAMQNINNPELLGSGIATAFVATIYGVGFANLIFIPIANKLKAVVVQRCLYQELIVEGWFNCWLYGARRHR